MSKTKPKDFASYSAAAQPFARPVLKKLRGLWRQAAPDASEAMKWGSPCFVGHSLLGGTAAFKAHVRLWLWKSEANKKAPGLFELTRNSEMGSMKVGSLEDLPSDRVLLAIFREAVRLDAKRAKSTKTAAPAKKSTRVITPKDFATAMKSMPKAAATYQALSPSCKREYLEWILEAKREGTREKRIATAVEWLSEGKDRNWRYR